MENLSKKGFVELQKMIWKRGVALVRYIRRVERDIHQDSLDTAARSMFIHLGALAEELGRMIRHEWFDRIRIDIEKILEENKTVVITGIEADKLRELLAEVKEVNDEIEERRKNKGPYWEG